MYGAAMEWLNYHHLRYFWAAAREGSVTRASEKLHVSQPAVSTQIRGLEQALGERLFTRSGRTLALTDAGRVVYRYAEEIFGLGTELMETLKGRPTGRPARLVVGIVNVIPAHRYRFAGAGLRHRARSRRVPGGQARAAPGGACDPRPGPGLGGRARSADGEGAGLQPPPRGVWRLHLRRRFGPRRSAARRRRAFLFHGRSTLAAGWTISR
jgi:hypothetical protein